MMVETQFKFQAIVKLLYLQYSRGDFLDAQLSQYSHTCSPAPISFQIKH